MFFRQIYDPVLAEAAYLIGCQRTGEAIIIDPERDVDRYIEAARAEGLRIVAVAETHIHADFLSGARELAERTGCRVYVSGEGGSEWRSRWLAAKRGGGAYDAVELHHDDEFRIGNILFRVVHTPGHTPEHIAYLVTDLGGGADEPMGVLSGDFVFVGDLGRPDLLETAAGVAGVAEPSAHQLHASVKAFLRLPDFLQVWPAHGAGSACGKALGAVPQSTVGYERRFNAALRLADDERGFVASILEGQPEPPLYFGRMKVENREGPRILDELPKPASLSSAASLRAAGADGATILDCRRSSEFRRAHVPGSLSAPFDPQFLHVAGSYVDPEREVMLVASPEQVGPVVRALIRIGIDRITGWLPPDLLAQDPGLTALPEIDVHGAATRMGDAGVYVLDVRRAAECAEDRITGSHNIAHTRLAARLDEIPKAGTILVHCRSGARSTVATAFLRAQGRDAVNVAGGMLAWQRAGLPHERGAAAPCAPCR